MSKKYRVGYYHHHHYNLHQSSSRSCYNLQELIKGKDTASQLYSAALKKADAAKAKKGANAKSK